MSADDLKAAKHDQPKDNKEIKAHLERLEATTGNSGAIPRTPKQQMLDIGDLAEKNPDYRYRWVKVNDAQKLQMRLMEGYTKVPEEEGGRSLGGSLVLMRIPRRGYEARVQRQNKITQERLTQHEHEMAAVAESVSRELYDRYGVKIPTSRILVSEI